jgi:hypothetical protein
MPQYYPFRKVANFRQVLYGHTIGGTSVQIPFRGGCRMLNRLILFTGKCRDTVRLIGPDRAIRTCSLPTISNAP